MKRSLFLFAVAAALCSCGNPSPGGKATASMPAWAVLPFTKVDSVNPVIIPDADQVFDCPLQGRPIHWEQKDVFNPAAIVRGDSVLLLYRAEDTAGSHAGTSRIGLAWSTDGLHFHKEPAPIFYPANDSAKRWEWDGGCEDPRVVQDTQGIYYMTYTAYDGDKARLFIASSPDLRHWTKHGSAFRLAAGGRYAAGWSKSGSIVSTYDNGTPVATRINGKYWMYWGDQNIWLATSDDLINWLPVMDNRKQSAMERRGIAVNFPELKVVFAPRAKKFDSDLVESGPPAMLTSKGIVLVYNGRNTHTVGDTALAEGTYAGGQVLLDATDPSKVLDRLESNFIRPDKPYERTGQVNQVCFLEGLVRFRDHWYLYYGTADSRIAVARKD